MELPVDPSEPAPSSRYRVIEAGDPAPWFSQRSTERDDFTFASAAGRYLVLGFIGSAADAIGRAATDALWDGRSQLDPSHVVIFGVSADRADEQTARARSDARGLRWFWDFDARISRAYGALPEQGEAMFRRSWLIIDPTLRVLARLPFAGPDGGVANLLQVLRALPPPDRFMGTPSHAPVLLLPQVFEPAFCTKLVEAYDRNGGAASGVMRVKNGRTVGVLDASFKVRSDYMLVEQPLIDAARARVVRRIVPEIQKAHQFIVTRMERYLVGCYSAEDGGHFNPHRDNNTAGTAHRRFAVSINLTDDFDGGEVSFPEYGLAGYKPPVGGALVFSCSLLHAVSRVSRGKRYAFLPFLYDEAAAEIRARNAHLLGEATAPRPTPPA